MALNDSCKAHEMLYTRFHLGQLAQLAEHSFDVGGVRGSSPLLPTHGKKRFKSAFFLPVEVRVLLTGMANLDSAYSVAQLVQECVLI